VKLRVSKKAPLSKDAKRIRNNAIAAQQDRAFVHNLRVWMGMPPMEPFVREYRFHPVRKWRFDYAFPEHKVAVEKDGGVWSGGKHGRGSGIVKDHEKQNHAAMLGWRILRCTPKQLADPAFAEMVVASLYTP
jgi:very-short-patch-repair endonuclease